jgi:hypothetical protein
MMMKLTEYDDDISSFYVEVDYIIVVRHHVMSQQLFSSNCRQLGIATDPSVAEGGRATKEPRGSTTWTNQPRSR